MANRSCYYQKRPQDELTFTQWDKWCKSEEDRAEYYKAYAEFFEVYAFLCEELEKTPFWRFCKTYRLQKLITNSLTWL